MVFHQFNPFTGKLKSSTNFQPFYPLSPVPLQKTEQIMIHDIIKTKPTTVTAKAGYCTDKPRTLSPELWEKYKHFQANIEKPVYLLGGKKDKILFGIAVAYVGICTLQSAVFFFQYGIMGKLA